MARYDREFLVPYLEDICALQLSKQKLQRMISSSQREISRIKEDALNKVEKPQLEAYKGDDDLGCVNGCAELVCGILGIVFFFVALFSGEPSMFLILLVFGVIEFILITHSLGAEVDGKREIKARNDEKEEDYAFAQMAALALAESKVNEVKARIASYENEIKKIDNLLERQYSVNIIPRWYRDLYPAVYLYDWFSNSRADDLDLALNTLVLEQIKDRLDTIIVNQGEMIINQRIMIANQQKSMDMMEAHHARLMAKLDRIEATNEDRNMYLSMIEANTAANAYFSAANYLKR